MTKLWSLGSNDFIKGLIVFVLSAVLTWAAQVVDAPGFDLATFSWVEVVRVAVVSTIAYLAKNFATDGNGNVLGVSK